MKLHTEIRNNRGGKKSTSDDTRILIELSYKNKDIGQVGLYAILGTDLKGNEVSGYRVMWNSNNTPTLGQTLEEVEIKGKKQKGDDECFVCHQTLDQFGRCGCCNKDAY